jgi:hypothetical protein
MAKLQAQVDPGLSFLGHFGPQIGTPKLHLTARGSNQDRWQVLISDRLSSSLPKGPEHPVRQQKPLDVRLLSDLSDHRGRHVQATLAETDVSVESTASNQVLMFRSVLVYCHR